MSTRQNYVARDSHAIPTSPTVNADPSAAKIPLYPSTIPAELLAQHPDLLDVIEMILDPYQDPNPHLVLDAIATAYRLGLQNQKGGLSHE